MCFTSVYVMALIIYNIEKIHLNSTLASLNMLVWHNILCDTLQPFIGVILEIGYKTATINLLDT